MINRVYESVLRKLLREAQPPKSSDRLAAAVSREDSFASATLYSPEEALAALRAAKRSGDLEAGDDPSRIARFLEPAVKGYVRIADPKSLGHGTCLASWEIINIAGPGMSSHLLSAAHALSPSGLVTIDRESVSPQGFNFWSRNSERRLKNPRTGEDWRFQDCTLHQPGDADCGNQNRDSLNYAFIPDGSEKHALSSLSRAHSSTSLEAQEELNIPPDDLTSALTDAAGPQMFAQKYF